MYKISKIKDGKEYWLKKDSFLENYQNRPVYMAYAKDKENNDYILIWEINDIDNFDETEPEDACDWDDFIVNAL